MVVFVLLAGVFKSENQYHGWRGFFAVGCEEKMSLDICRGHFDNIILCPAGIFTNYILPVPTCTEIKTMIISRWRQII